MQVGIALWMLRLLDDGELNKGLVFALGFVFYYACGNCQNHQEGDLEAIAQLKPHAVAAVAEYTR